MPKYTSNSEEKLIMVKLYNGYFSKKNTEVIRLFIICLIYVKLCSIKFYLIINVLEST